MPPHLGLKLHPSPPNSPAWHAQLCSFPPELLPCGHLPACLRTRHIPKGWGGGSWE